MATGPLSTNNSFPLVSGAPPAFSAGTPGFPWWKQYEAGLSGAYGWPQRITPTTLAELDTSSDSIHSSIPSLANSASWSAINYRYTGVVVGAIQSGKTRSMVAVVAKAFDLGFPIAVVLSGLKNDLREQTARRFHTDLLQHGEGIIDGSGRLVGYTHPRGAGCHGTRRDFWANPSALDAHEVGSLSAQIISALSKNEAVLLVIKKQRDALRAVTMALDAVWQYKAQAVLPLIVVDDECDEASVPATVRARLPNMITRLWGNAAANQPVAYIGYTATPQANVFQNIANPLYPNDVHTLRAPSDASSSITYRESGLPADWYTGTDVFFEWLEQQGCHNFLIRDSVTVPEVERLLPWPQSQLREAIIAFFVSGAIRLAVSGKKLGCPPYDAPAHSMLVHTDLQRDAHWELAEAVCEICRSARLRASALRGILPENRIDSHWMAQWLGNNPHEWQAWYHNFQNGFNVLQSLYSGRYRPHSFPSWATVAAILPHVFDNVKLKIINSDADADRLDFARLVDPTGVPIQPEDVFTIIVGGNVLSRGLTIEGLCTSYFTRWPNVPLDDTTMQRQRWLGYRGSHLEFCRVFSSPEIIAGLRRASNSDVASRQQMAFFAAAGVTDVKASYILFQGAGRPTGKIGTGRGVDPTFTGAKPFVRYVQGQTVPGGACPFGTGNERAASSLTQQIRTAGATRTNADGTTAGYVLTSMPAIDVANFLEKLEYVNHNPAVLEARVQAFDAVERVCGLPAGTFHRRPFSGRSTGVAIPESYDPYLIAAYLRMWHHAFIIATSSINRFLGANLRPWVPVSVPNFNLVYRCGSKAPPSGSLFTDFLTDKIIDRGADVRAAWGRSGTLDEEWFDMGAPPPTGPASPRQATDSGLMMLYVIHRGSLGAAQCHELPTVGIVVPCGGPSLKATAGA